MVIFAGPQERLMVRYTLDPASSRFTVQAFAGGMLSGFGHSPTFAVRQFTGEVGFTPETLADASLRLTVRAESLTLTDSVSAKDRQEIEGQMRLEVLEAAAYPEIDFQSAGITADRVADNWYRLRIQGELRLHGVKRPQQVDAQLRILEDQVRLSGQCALSLSAYRIKPVTALGGLIKLKDELKLDFDLAGRELANDSTASKENR
jgi:polyisoprenoid-binding protein YceI